MAARIPGSHFARNLVKRKSLLFQLVKRDLQQRYVGSAAGWVWSIIHPLVLWASYVFIFQILQTVKLENGLTDSFPLNLFVGMLPWLLFSETVQRSASSIVEHANLITKTMFPSEILPVAIFLSSLASNMVVTALTVVVAAFYQGHVNPALAMLLLYVPVIGLFGVGLGWITAALQVYLRDTAQMVTVMFTFWFWLTPIIVQPERFLGWEHWVLRLNPMAYVVQAYRVMLLGRGAPAFAQVATAVGFAVVTFVAGGLFFRQMKKGFADVL